MAVIIPLLLCSPPQNMTVALIHQQMESIPLTTDSGLALIFALTNRMWLMW